MDDSAWTPRCAWHWPGGYREGEVATRFAGKDPVGAIQKPYNLEALREFFAGLSAGPDA